MFYPADSLRRGGRFYLLWVADSYPLRFAAITRRQLWSQDIRKLCADLHLVIMSESGRRTHRYSLRLSSQLMRGLVKLYQRKVDALLNDLCMIYSSVTKHVNRRYLVQEETEQVRDRPRNQGESRRRSRTSGPRAQEEQRVEEILQNSLNVVANIQDITLREAVIPEVVLPNDGFGEEHPDQALRLLGDRTVEMMLAQPDAAQLSVLDVATLEGEKSHDKTRLGPVEVEMEMISGLDNTLVRPSVGFRQSAADLEREIPEIPDVPLLPIPEAPVPAPQERQQQLEEIMPEAPVAMSTGDQQQIETVQVPSEIQLEVLEELEPRPKRPRRLVIDKKMKLTGELIRSRICNPRVDIKYEKFSDAIIDIRVPTEVYMGRPCHAGYKECSSIAPALTRLFLRNLGYIHRDISSEREMEEAAMLRQRTRTASRPERIREVEETPQVAPIPKQQPEIPQEITVQENITFPQLELEAPRDLPNEGQLDISEMLTQKLQTVSQQEQRESNKRVSEDNTETPNKRRHTSNVPINETRRRQPEPDTRKQSTVAGVAAQSEMDMDVDKENVPINQQTQRKTLARDPSERRLIAILQEAGLNDAPMEPPQEPQDLQTSGLHQTVPRTSRRPQSESSETPLGSLDRTKVSLGDSDKTTESARFINEEWSTANIMKKIYKRIQKRKEHEEITVKTLVEQGPILADYKSIIAAKCFTSILKLKQVGFIKVIKCPDSLEIKDIILGPELLSKTHRAINLLRVLNN